MMKVIKALVLPAVLLVWAPFPAVAALIDGGTYATDTGTGLDWVKLNVLSDYSYLNVQNGALGYTSSGWRYATRPELVDLFTRYVGAQNGQYNGYPITGQSPSYFTGANDLVVALGLNVAFSDSRAYFNLTGFDLHQITIQGFYDDGNSADGVGFAEATAVFSAGPNYYDTSIYDAVPFGRWGLFPSFRRDDESSSNKSSFLVRASTNTPIPEPSSWTLVVAELLILASFRHFFSKGNRHTRDCSRGPPLLRARP